MRKHLSLAAVALPLVLASSLMGKDQVASASGLKQTPAKAVPSEQTPSDSSMYVIGPGDVLSIDVWKEPELTRNVSVRFDGKISLPLLGDVQATGNTPMQLASSLTSALTKYITVPQVTVIVAAMNSRRIYILGEVAHPGPVSLVPNMTVLQALASAGGPGQFANLKAMYILRNENGKQVSHPFNYKAVIRGKSPQQNIVLNPGDTIVVP
jgi:polysaccharide export outer membrane protein